MVEGGSQGSSAGGSEGPDPRLALFAGKSSRDVLQRLWDGDPLDVWPRCLRRLAKRAVLMDGARLFTTATVRAAHEGIRAQRIADLDAWIDERVDRAIDELLIEDRENDRRGLPVDPRELADHDFICQAMSLPPLLGRKACVMFNSLSDEQRRAVWAVVVDGRTPESSAEQVGLPVETVQNYLQDVARRLAALGKDGPPPRGGDPGGGKGGGRGGGRGGRGGRSGGRGGRR